MSAVAGPFFAAAGLLGVAGAAKVARPSSTAEALRAAALPGTTTGGGFVGSPMAGRLLGAVEVVVSLAALALGGRTTAALVAVTYVAFALFTLRLLRTAGAGADCGCFGADESPASGIHVVVNLAIAAVGAFAVARPAPGLVTVIRAQPLAGLPFVGVTVVCGWLLFAFLTVVPELRAAAAAERPDASPSGARP